ncbi:hypothetical protein AJ79_02554 [Helicocarpus griseus UAMH5409]|uniref:Uncharacterized protein n=1 Tax=Helicocarpus griseus UAMH5409 TaxID=1447875 RepID=A0A2B7Y232_9EURO|nr:hypothetical protein AJ79_02554 [Helicocarpus griseus UAMH5409]
MPSANRLILLSNIISEKTKVITDFLASKGLEPPSFDARLELIAATEELHILSLGPRDHIKNICWVALDPLSLQGVCTFKVAEAVPLTSQIPYEEVTKKCHELSGIYVPLYNMRRIIRHAITNHFPPEPELGPVAHNRASRLLLEDETLNAWVELFTVDKWPGFRNAIAAMKKWPGSEESNRTRINVAYGNDLRWFDHISRPVGSG